MRRPALPYTRLSLYPDSRLRDSLPRLEQGPGRRRAAVQTTCSGHSEEARAFSFTFGRGTASCALTNLLHAKYGKCPQNRTTDDLKRQYQTRNPTTHFVSAPLRPSL